MEAKLESIFSNVCNWLRFAEEKNAALVVLNGGILFALMTMIDGDFELPDSIINNLFYYQLTLFYLLNFVLFSSVGLLIALISFLPQTKGVSQFGKAKIENNDDLLFFSHIAKYDAHTYLTKLYKLLDENDGYTDYELSYAKQIIANSKITTSKYFIFKIALWFTVSSIFTPIIGYALFFLLDDTDIFTKFSLLALYLLSFVIFYWVMN